MIKIFYVIDSFDMGGAQRQLLEVMQRLDRRRYQAVVCPLWPLMALEADYQQTGWPIIRVHKRAHLDVSVAWRLAREMQTFQPHIVHTWLFTGNLWGRLAAAWARVPVVIASERVVTPPEAAPRYVFWTKFILAKLSDAIIFNSWANLNEMRLPVNEGRPMLRVVHNGVDEGKFNERQSPAWRQEKRTDLNIPPGAFVILTVGRLTTQKAQDTLLRAMHVLMQNGQDCHLLLAGDGPKSRELELLSVELHLQDCVTFLGLRRDIPQLLAASDLFVLPSSWEGFPNVILEAMAMARPVVATDVAGVSELVEHEVTGLLVKSGDPNHLAQAIRKLMHAPGLAAQMGVAGRQRVERQFSVERMVAKTTDLYDDLLRQKGIRP